MARSGRRACLAFGQDITRAENGLFYAMDMLSSKAKVPVKAVRIGLQAVKVFSRKAVNRLQRSRISKSAFIEANGIAAEIEYETVKIDEELQKTSSNGTLAKKLKAVRKYTLALRKYGEQACR